MTYFSIPTPPPPLSPSYPSGYPHCSGRSLQLEHRWFPRAGMVMLQQDLPLQPHAGGVPRCSCAGLVWHWNSHGFTWQHSQGRVLGGWVFVVLPLVGGCPWITFLRGRFRKHSVVGNEQTQVLCFSKVFFSCFVCLGIFPCFFFNLNKFYSVATYQDL